MTVAPKINYVAVSEYLRSEGIDAKRIPVASISPEGYEYWPDTDSQQIRLTSSGTTVIGSEQKQWSSPEVYENVQKLIAGGTIEDVTKDKQKADPTANKETVPKKAIPQKSTTK